jgi:FlaA1/EpsC-like NDP-sugar epimerase
MSTSFMALLIRFEGTFHPVYMQTIAHYLPEIIVIRILCFYGFGLYQRLWRYASISELVAIVGAVTTGTAILAVYMFIMGANLPKSIHVLAWILTIALIGASRLFVRLAAYFKNLRKSHVSRTLIVGAGDAGAAIAREINQRYFSSKKLVGFVDDDSYKQKQMLFGVPVLGNRDDIPQIVKHNGINEIIIAIPSAEGTVVRDIVRTCKLSGCTVKIVPGIYELLDGKVTVQQLREVDLEDLLRREPVALDITQIAEYLMDKRVLVTGAGGSIGSELCRQIAKLKPQCLILLGKGENSIYEINRALTEKFEDLDIIPVIADIRDKDRIAAIFKQYKPHVVFHAAAHKHVPLMEAQPEEAVRNNVFGTRIVAEAADRFGAEKFVMISTDKAVNPTSVMGATKRVAELIIQNLNGVSETKYTAVRFGNVLGSRGSVIPLFKQQIAKGGPITITHPEMRRYFMTIPEASQLVLQAGALAHGGEVFVLDMGEPVKIVDMASDLIELSGLKPGRDIEIKFTGLRPGEKLFEELLTAEEGTTSTKHKSIYMANLREMDTHQLFQDLRDLQEALQTEDVIRILGKLVPTYQSNQVQYREINSKQEKKESRRKPSVSMEGYSVLSNAGYSRSS